MKRTLKFKGVGEYIIDTDTMEFRAKYERFKGLPDKVLEFRDMLWDIFTSPDPNKRLSSESIAAFDHSFVQEMTFLSEDIGYIMGDCQIVRNCIANSRVTSDKSGKLCVIYYILSLRFNGCCLLKNLISVGISTSQSNFYNDGMEVYRYVAENMTRMTKDWIKERGYGDCYLGSKAGLEILGLIRGDISKKCEEISSRGS